MVEDVDALRGASVTGLTCVRCGREFGPRDVAYTCPDCGPEGILDVAYDYEQARRALSRESLGNSRDNSHWRYRWWFW